MTHILAHAKVDFLSVNLIGGILYTDEVECESYSEAPQLYRFYPGMLILGLGLKAKFLGLGLELLALALNVLYGIGINNKANCHIIQIIIYCYATEAAQQYKNHTKHIKMQ